MGWMSERWHYFIKRLLFNYESSLLGELLSAIAQERYITVLNRSSMKDTRPAALAVSYYAWSLVGHGVFILSFIAFIIVRAVWAVCYVRWRHGSLWNIFSEPCCVDSTLGTRNKMTMLDGYLWENGKLNYRADGLKAFGLLKTEEENGDEFLVLRKLHWFKIPDHDWIIIGTILRQCTVLCDERSCTGVVSFFDRGLGGCHVEMERRRSSLLLVRSISFSVSPSP